MLPTKGDPGPLTRVPDEEEYQGKEKRALAWIRKYLDLADLLIKRGKHKHEFNEHDDSRNQRKAA